MLPSLAEIYLRIWGGAREGDALQVILSLDLEHSAFVVGRLSIDRRKQSALTLRRQAVLLNVVQLDRTRYGFSVVDKDSDLCFNAMFIAFICSEVSRSTPCVSFPASKPVNSSP